jgi:hypothetical protein
MIVRVPAFIWPAPPRRPCPPLDSPTCEFSDSDLAVVTRHGPTVVGNLEGREPYFDPAGVVQVGRRDESVAIAPENEAVAASGIPKL